MAEDSPKKPKPTKRRRRTTTKSNKPVEEIIKPKKTPKRCRTRPVDYNDDDAVKHGTKIRRRNGIILASIKPSYCLKLGIGSCITEQGETIESKHKKRLRKLLKKLILRHNWVEASGVLSVLLKSTPKDISTHNNRIKYGNTLELVKRIQGDTINLRKIQNIYELWMKKSGFMKNLSLKERFAVQVEYTLFCLTQGKLEDAHQASLCLMQERGFDKEPISNLIVGLTFYALWYSSLPQDWKITEQFDYEQSEAVKNSDRIDSEEINFTSQTNSISSVANDKDNNMEIDSDENKENSIDINKLQNQTPQKDIYVHESEDENSSSSNHSDNPPQMSIFYTEGLPTFLLPLKMPNLEDEDLDNFLLMHRKFQNDQYKNGIKHLRQALHNSPPIFEALHPLIQMLLLGDKVNEALEELENPFYDSDKALKLRLKAGLLEHFDSQNYLRLCTCYEEILKVDPTCTNSLTKLINMNHRGDYSTEKLVNIIALHLDDTYPESEIWKEFASGLFKLSLCSRDQMSICAEEINDNNYVNRIPELFYSDDTGNEWNLRCRWWKKRHFNPNIAKGDLELLCWKAASASFLYGQEFKYVVEVIELLKKENINLYNSLQIHVRNSVGFYKLDRI